MSAIAKIKASQSNAFPNVDEIYECSYKGISTFKSGDVNYIFLELNTKNSSGVQAAMSMIVNKQPDFSEDEKLEIFKVSSELKEGKTYPKLTIEELA